MSQWGLVISDNLPWPMVHVFVPAIVSIYVRDIWVLISVIYIFESVEFLGSQIPGADYWGEDSKADTLVSDIVMGLLGFAAVVMLNVKQTDDRPWYAYLKPKKNSSSCYKKMAGPIHVALSGMATIFIVVGAPDILDIPLIWQYVGFGGLYVLVALLFGFTEWAIFSFVCICIISGLSTILGYNVIVSLCVVLMVSGLFVAFRSIKKRKVGSVEAKKLSKVYILF